MKLYTRRMTAAMAALILAGQLTLPAAALGGSDTGLLSGDVEITQAFSDAKLIAWLKDARNLNGAGADGVLTLAERQAVTSLDLSGQGLTSLEGLEAFPNLETLNCSQNKLTELDLTQNPNLTRLYCTDNLLTELDVSKNPKLISLYCAYNRLTSLDVSGHGDLVALNCEMNLLTELDLSGCTSLLSLYCRNNLLKTLDLTDNTALEFIETFANQLTSIDVTHLSELNFLHIDHNKLTTLDMSGNLKLEGGGFVARNNMVETIKLPNSPQLTVYLDDYEEQDPIEGHDRAEWFLDREYQTPAPKELKAEGQTLYSRRVPISIPFTFLPTAARCAIPTRPRCSTSPTAPAPSPCTPCGVSPSVRFKSPI